MEDQTHWNEVHAHVIPEENLEQSIRKLQLERDDCVEKKQLLEQQLNKIENWKRSETSVILARGLEKTRSITATANLEVAVRKKKVPILHAKAELEKRLRELKSELSRLREIKDRIPEPERKREDVEVLLRIEKLLLKLVAAAPMSESNVDLGAQKSPSSVSKIQAEAKYVKRELASDEASETRGGK